MSNNLYHWGVPGMKWGRRKAKLLEVVPIKSNKKLDDAVDTIAKSSMTESQKIQATNQIMGQRITNSSIKKIGKKKFKLKYRARYALVGAGLIAIGANAALKYAALKVARSYVDNVLRKNGYNGPI